MGLVTQAKSDAIGPQDGTSRNALYVMIDNLHAKRSWEDTMIDAGSQPDVMGSMGSIVLAWQIAAVPVSSRLPPDEPLPLLAKRQVAYITQRHGMDLRQPAW